MTTRPEETGVCPNRLRKFGTPTRYTAHSLSGLLSFKKTIILIPTSSKTVSSSTQATAKWHCRSNRQFHTKHFMLVRCTSVLDFHGTANCSVRRSFFSNFVAASMYVQSNSCRNALPTFQTHYFSCSEQNTLSRASPCNSLDT